MKILDNITYMLIMRHLILHNQYDQPGLKAYIVNTIKFQTYISNNGIDFFWVLNFQFEAFYKELPK